MIEDMSRAEHLIHPDDFKLDQLVFSLLNEIDDIESEVVDN